MSLEFSADLVNLVLYALFLASVVAVPFYILHGMQRQLRGEFGRPYAMVVDELFKEGTRRAMLLARVAEAREARLERQERRLETGR